MIGFYNYTVVLTYLSLVSASTGIFVALSDKGHPYIGIIFLLFCGLCDAFDGKVARTKKGRSSDEQKFGIQIDSLSDIIAFGVLPAAIGATLLRVRPKSEYIFGKELGTWKNIFSGFLFAILGLYSLFQRDRGGKAGDGNNVQKRICRTARHIFRAYIPHVYACPLYSQHLLQGR